MGKALYRKYRPISLDTVVGQSQVVAPLKESLKRNKISHAYLFCGPRGTGKTSIARIFAHEINGFKYELEDSLIDIIEIDAASNTGVDNIRELREKAIIAPVEGKYKVYIIDEVHMLSKSAFNALLKLMEEPPAHVVFIMATTNPEKIPITITSRSQIYTFNLASEEVIVKHLGEIAKKEKIDIAPDALQIIAERGGGSFRDSISLLDQISSLSTDRITAEAVDKALGLPTAAKISALLEKYSAGDITGATEILRELLNSGTSAESLAAVLISNITKNPSSQTLHLATKLFDVQYPFAEAKLLLAFLGTGSAPAVQAPAVAQPTPKPTSSEKPAPSAKPTPSEDESETPAKEPAPAKKPTALSSADFFAAVRKENPAISNLLKRGTVEISDSSIEIFPNNQMTENILHSEQNLDLLRKIIPDRTIVVHSHTEKSASKTDSNPQISAIMGNVEEVIDDGDPFPTE